MQGFAKLPVEEQENRLLELAGISLAFWNLDGDLRLIKHRENAVYELNTTGGERFALRVHRAGYHSDRSLKSELQWIEALNDYGVGVPGVIPPVMAIPLPRSRQALYPGQDRLICSLGLMANR